MPSSHRHFRALREDFRLFVSRRSAWPPLKAFARYLEENADGYAKAHVTQMKQGAAVPEKYVAALIALMRGKPAMDEFLRSEGIGNPAGLIADQIMDHAAGPVSAQPAPKPGANDWFLKGVDALITLFSDYVWGVLEREGTRCKNEDDVRAAASMVLETHARHHQRGSDSLSHEAAIRIAEAGMGESLESYSSRAIDLWQKNPWTIAFAVVDRRRVACNFILPLKASVYEEVRAGTRSLFSCFAGDLPEPSVDFFFEALAERPETEYADTAKRTAQQLRTAYLQLAHMSLGAERNPLLHDQAIRVLTLAATPVNKRRIMKSGYRATGTREAGSHLELFEYDNRKGWASALVIGYLQRRILDSKP